MVYINLKQDPRVEGRGAATIHDVSISTIPQPPVVTTSETLTELLLTQERTQKALARCNKSLASLETFLGTLNTQDVDASKLTEITDSYDATAEKLDDKAGELEKRLKDIEKSIDEERTKLVGPGRNRKLDLQASVIVFAEGEDEVQIALIYGVSRWFFYSM